MASWEWGPLTCAPSADAVAGNGRPLSYSLRSPSADAVAGGGNTRSWPRRLLVAAPGYQKGRCMPLRPVVSSRTNLSTSA